MRWNEEKISETKQNETEIDSITLVFQVCDDLSIFVYLFNNNFTTD